MHLHFSQTVAAPYVRSLEGCTRSRKGGISRPASTFRDICYEIVEEE